MSLIHAAVHNIQEYLSVRMMISSVWKVCESVLCVCREVFGKWKSGGGRGAENSHAFLLRLFSSKVT
jgi:hypothetical protein